MEKFGIDLVFSSRNNQLQSILGSTKDPIKTVGKPGIHKATCSHCHKIYGGQTKRILEERLNEHLAKDVKSGRNTVSKGFSHLKSLVAEHIVIEKHDITKHRR